MADYQRKQFPFADYESKWQEMWLESKAFRAANPDEQDFDPNKPKYYVLDMFPYPSGEGLHVGHVEGYTATDIIARYKRMRGFNVLHPMGWDAFGLPAEQFAIKTGQHPRITTEKNIARFRAQLQAIGFSYDWSREISTTDPNYFRWTQWIFLKLYNSWFNPATQKAEPIETYSGDDPDNVRLAYIAEIPVNWCPGLGTVLANEEVVDGKSEVGGFAVERRPMRQWMLRITAYAERLINELESLDWPESIKHLQRNWIGRSEGAEIHFKVADNNSSTITVFTTRPDTLYGVTYLVLAPEHPLVDEISTAEQIQAVEAYKTHILSKSDLERTELNKEKSGVFTGAYAINPVNNEQVPIWIADYVLMGYGTGAVMAVPAHDERDFEFAKKNALPVREVVTPHHFAATSTQGGTDVPSVLSPFFEEHKEITVHERNLPHWEQPGKLYFLTWRLVDSMPKELLDKWKQEIESWENNNPKPWTNNQLREYHNLASERIEKWLDTGRGECLLNQQEVADITINALTHFDNEKYELEAFVIMPNHVHALVRLFENVNLSSILQSWKNYSAKKINSLLGREGAVWQSEYFDRIVRSFEHKARIKQYLIENAKQANIENTNRLFVKQTTMDETSVPPSPASAVACCTTTDGIAINSPIIDGLPTAEAKKRITAWLEEHGVGKLTINYKLRDWLFSRQRYWGEPFPIIWENSQHHALDESELPVEPPAMEDFKPTGTPEPPLSKAKDWVRYSDRALRETNTMPQWAGSCWYYLRFCDPTNSDSFIGKPTEKYWASFENRSSKTDHGRTQSTGFVDLYVGGTEHAVLHLLYARFWHKVLYDLGYLSTIEPFQRLVNQGIILGSDNRKMSKSLGNVVSPEEVINEFGADSLRLYEMFMGPIEQMKPWSMKGVEGVYRFLGRVWRLAFFENQEGQWQINPDLEEVELTSSQRKVIHQTIKKVTEDTERFGFNTAISQMMIFVNEFTNAKPKPLAALRTLLPLLSPYAPHITEEIWHHLSQAFPGFSGQASTQSWPSYDESFLVENEVEMVIQINGKLRGRIVVASDADKTAIEQKVVNDEKVKIALGSLAIAKVIIIPGKLINIVAK